MPREDQWVAVAPQFATSKSEEQIKPAQSAYQFFQRHVTTEVKQEMERTGEKFDVGKFSRLVRDKWNQLDDKEHYEELAMKDMLRYRQECHVADVQKMEQQRQKQQERSEITIFDDVEGKKSTRRAIQKQQRKQEKKRKKLLEKKAAKSDDTEWTSDMEDEEFSDTWNSDDESSESDNGTLKKKRKATAPRKVSDKVMARQQKARQEKAAREDYVEQRQELLRKDRADQAKRRLEFLLQQSDIFSHFGAVKEESAKYGITNKKKDRRSNIQGENDELDKDELDESTSNKQIYLTAQPTTLGFGTMRPYQLEGLNWMIRLQENGVNGVLADEMGLGKTLQSISILVYMQEYQGSQGPHLIVVPKSTLSNWMNEIKRWAPTMKAVKFHGNKEEREELAKNIMEPGQRDEHRDWHICVTTYEVCNIDKNVLNKFAWQYLIIDEAHRLKNEASTFSKTIRTFETRYRLLLTGTPLQNNLHELWALLNFLVPDVFASAEQFDEWFNLDIDDADEKNKLISQLHKILRPFMLRRLKADVETGLPPKHETILFTGMSALQKKLYRDILLRDFEVLQGGGSGSKTALLNIVMQLRKCAGHPYLFPGVEDRSLPPLGEHLVVNCGKMVLLDKLLRRLKERGHRVLLFTQMTRILDIMEDYCVMRQYAYCRIDGNTGHELREEYIDAYNKPNSEKFIFLLSTRAGGLGINLQTADVVILYDSDWNPQADLQAQDRAHRIGQKREVQVFRFVTEHTIEEKVVERAQQKLKLDAMIVQQGRLKEKDTKLSRDELLEAVRFGADKVFKSKDSSITDDDIDIILNAGKRKTQELNDKLQAADKGDLLDFKLDGGGLSAQTFEGVDYAKAALQQQQDLLMLDIGKRERRTVANYNESHLYQQQLGPKKPKRKKEFKLPKDIRLPRMEEWQMYDRVTLTKIQEEEETSFKTLPEEDQKMATQKPQKDEQEQRGEGEVKPPFVLPPLISAEKQAEKDGLLAEGFSKWSRLHYTTFIRASAKYGRTQISKIASDVGKPTEDVGAYAKAFWSIGKNRFSENEYERAVKVIERGEKKMDDLKGLQRGTRMLVGIFDNPWKQLEFTFTNCKDKMFTAAEDRQLLCWTHKFGYGQWEAIKMSIRRSPEFRFDYFLRSLPVDLIGRRCEQLMKAAEKEVEAIERWARDQKGLPTEGEDLPPVELPKFETMRLEIRKKALREADEKRKELEGKVLDIEEQMKKIQDRLKILNEYTREVSSRNAKASEFPEELLPALVNLVAKSGPLGIMSVANSFLGMHPGASSKTKVCSKIELVAVKEKRDGDTKPIWYIGEDYSSFLDVDTLRFLRKAKEERADATRSKKKAAENTKLEDTTGAWGPDGDFMEFPPYDGKEAPKEKKKAFTHFCNKSRKEVKASLPPEERKNKPKVNGILKEWWLSLSDDEKQKWRKYEEWDTKRFERDSALHERAQSMSMKAQKKKRKDSDMEGSQHSAQESTSSVLSIPKKRKI